MSKNKTLARHSSIVLPIRLRTFFNFCSFLFNPPTNFLKHLINRSCAGDQFLNVTVGLTLVLEDKDVDEEDDEDDEDDEDNEEDEDNKDNEEDDDEEDEEDEDDEDDEDEEEVTGNPPTVPVDNTPSINNNPNNNNTPLPQQEQEQERDPPPTPVNNPQPPPQQDDNNNNNNSPQNPQSRPQQPQRQPIENDRSPPPPTYLRPVSTDSRLHVKNLNYIQTNIIRSSLSQSTNAVSRSYIFSF